MLTSLRRLSRKPRGFEFLRLVVWYLGNTTLHLIGFAVYVYVETKAASPFNGVTLWELSLKSLYLLNPAEIVISFYLYSFCKQN
jgi:hypothetical protein